MKELVKVFDGHDVRTVIIRGEPWFVAKDVCDVLGLEQVSRAVSRLDEDQRGLLKVPHPQSPSSCIEMAAVNESGLYSLIIRSNKPEAKTFRHWVTSEVLPSIRKTGRYDIHDLRAKSVETRNGITAEWDRQGVHGMQFATLTMEQSKILFGNRNLKKADMDRSQIKALMALEAVEQYKLSVIEDNRLGYSGCRDSMKDTAIMLESVKRQAIEGATA